MGESIHYMDRALFVWDTPSKKLVDSVVQNSLGTKVTAVEYKRFAEDPPRYLKDATHIVVSGNLSVYAALLKLADQYHFSLAFLPLKNQQRFIKHFGLSNNLNDNIKTALQDRRRTIDIVYCNGQPVIFDAYMGRIPLLRVTKGKGGAFGFLGMFFRGIRQFLRTHLIPIEIETAGGKVIQTAASGIYLQHRVEGAVSRFLPEKTGVWDGRVSAIFVSPFSLIEYLKFLLTYFMPAGLQKSKPRVIGHIRSNRIEIRPSKDLVVDVDDFHRTPAPLICEVVKDAVQINAGPLFWETKKGETITTDYVDTESLPNEKEIPRYTQKFIPFFSYASESRFNYLFDALKEDAQTTNSYVILMVLSTILATIGLLLNSSSVVIGAMLLAPLMTPIVSFSMGLLRGDNFLLKHSSFKIGLGILIGLLSSIALTYVVPYFKLTSEISGRINPTILDLGVAISAGIGAAYTKSSKKIYQSLAGVAVAVALVPPLAVAGIGICHMEFYIFFGAFLLFLTNLVGITLSATFTFQVMGYSAALKKKKSFLAILLVLLTISFPLYLSFNQIRQNHLFSKTLKQERYLVNGKYIIISGARISSIGDHIVLNLDLTVRDKLSREDFELLKEKIQTHFKKKLYISADMNYIL